MRGDDILTVADFSTKKLCEYKQKQNTCKHNSWWYRTHL